MFIILIFAYNFYGVFRQALYKNIHTHSKNIHTYKHTHITSIITSLRPKTKDYLLCSISSIYEFLPVSDLKEVSITDTIQVGLGTKFTMDKPCIQIKLTTGAEIK